MTIQISGNMEQDLQELYHKISKQIIDMIPNSIEWRAIHYLAKSNDHRCYEVLFELPELGRKMRVLDIPYHYCASIANRQVLEEKLSEQHFKMYRTMHDVDDCLEQYQQPLFSNF